MSTLEIQDVKASLQEVTRAATELCEEKMSSLQEVTRAVTELCEEERVGLQVANVEAEYLEAPRKALKSVADRIQALSQERAATEAERHLLAVRQKDLEEELDEIKNGLVETIISLSKEIRDLEPLKPLALITFCDIARWKVHSFLVTEGCKELWMDKGWNNMVLGIGQNPYWQQVLLAQGVSMDSLRLLGYGAGSLQQNQGSEAAHAGPEKDGNLDVESSLGSIRAYAKCISLQKADDRTLLSHLFEFCFAAGEYIRFT